MFCRERRRSALLILVLGVGFAAGLTAVEGAAAAAPSKPAVPQKYVVDYPPAMAFCPPVETFFYEVVRTFEVVRGKRFTHQPNGGYGLPVVQKVGGKNLLHVGADVAWHRPGAPVYAVAAGVVRVSEGPEFSSVKRKRTAPNTAASKTLHWGNLIVIEHRLPDGEYFTTIYGHLNTKRFVQQGDIVAAGQQIGTVGRKHKYINGGYDPHVHFGMRRGRLAEPGCTLLYARFQGRAGPIKLAKVTPDEIEIEIPPEVPPLSGVQVMGTFRITVRDGKYFLPARMLWTLTSRPGFEMVGYGLTTDGWHDPVAFLRQHRADHNPAPFQGPKTQRPGR